MQSGNCTHCGKYIQQNLGKHIALFHIELDVAMSGHVVHSVERNGSRLC